MRSFDRWRNGVHRRGRGKHGLSGARRRSTSGGTGSAGGAADIAIPRVAGVVHAVSRHDLPAMPIVAPALVLVHRARLHGARQEIRAHREAGARRGYRESEDEGEGAAHVRSILSESRT